MKLNKQSLMYALVCATNKTAGLMFAEAQNSLQNGTLEIDGYERVQWTRFNPQDSDTFPPPGHYLCAYKDDEVYPAYRSDKCTDEKFASLSHDIEYWRPFPKPPTEIKESK